jgi:hypothetical protein
MGGELATLPGERRQRQLRITEAKASTAAAEADRAESLECHRGLEGELQAIEAKIDKYRETEMQVRTNTQLWAVQEEISQAQKAGGGIETKILEEMENVDQLDSEIARREVELVEVERVTRLEIEEIDKRQVELELEGSRVSTDVEELRITVDVDLQARYDRVKTRRDGVALGEAAAGTCLACNVRLRPQLWLEVLNMEAPVQCDNCQRILFAREALDLPSSINVTIDD